MTFQLPWPSVKNADGSLNPEAVQADFDELVRNTIGTGGQSLELRVGIGTWTWPGGSPISNLTVVSHGLGHAPVFVAAFAASDQGAAEMLTGSAVSVGTTSFSSRGAFRALALGAGGTATFYWLALG